MKKLFPLTLVLHLFFFCSGYASTNNVRKENNTDSTLNALNAKARAAYMKGDFDESRKSLEEVLNLKLKFYSNQKANIANTYSNIAIAYESAWDFENAIELAYKATENYAEEDSTNKNVGNMLLYINYLYANIGDYEKAQQYYNYFLNFNEKHGYQNDIHSMYYTKGMLYNYLKDYANARKNWLEYAKIVKDKYTVYNNLALNYIQTGEIEEAEEYYQKILKLPDLRESEM